MRYSLAAGQASLFSLRQEKSEKIFTESKKASPKPPGRQRGTEMFSPSALKETISLMPSLPDTESLEEIRAFLRKHLHFNSEGTRRDYAGYIVKRMFAHGYADLALRAFAKEYQSRQELSDACFYRFCKSEPLMQDVIIQLLIPAIGTGRISRQVIRDYLGERFEKSHKYVPKCAQAIVETLNSSGMAKVSRDSIHFSYRDVLIPSFAFVLHSEFPEPGMYDINKLEHNPAVQAMLWNPDRILPSLYELRNLSIVGKISQIDNIRQFTTKLNLAEVVGHLVAGSGKQ